MKLVKILSIGLCLSAFTVAANAQQQTTQKQQSETPATPSSELKKTETEKKSTGTLTVTERNSAVRRHKETKSNGASPSLTDSKSQPARTNANRQSTGMRDNTAPAKTNTTGTKRDGDAKQ